MPRGVKKTTVDLDEQLKAVEEQISELEDLRREIMEKKRNADMKVLTDFMEAEGLSAKDVIEVLKDRAVAASATTKDQNV